MATHTITTKAWVSQYSTVTPQELQEGSFTNGVLYGDYDPAPEGWTCVGDAVIAFTPADGKTIIDNKVEALRAEAAAVRAEATARVTHIESQIQNLLAISYDDQVQA